MKKLILLLFIPLISFGQYSSYYGAYDVNVNADVNINKNVNKTIATIDYGALSLANAQMEKNRLESLMYSDKKEKSQAIEIAMNPLKAFDYGKDNYWKMDKKTAESMGFSKGTVYYHKIPHQSLFFSTGGYNYRNESKDGVVTEIELKGGFYEFGSTEYLNKSENLKKEIFDNRSRNIEEVFKSWKKSYEVGKVIMWDLYNFKFLKNGNFTHKTEINKAKVFGEEGFVFSWFYENDYEYVIEEFYMFKGESGLEFNAIVRFRGDIDDIDFEMLEGRREYLKRFCKQMIATAGIRLGKKGLNK